MLDTLLAAYDAAVTADDLIALDDDEIVIAALTDADIAEAIEAEADAYDPQDRTPLA